MKIRRPESEGWKQTDDTAKEKQQRGCKTCEKPMRGRNDDHGINGCHWRPQSNEPKHGADIGPVVDHHEASNH